MKRIVTGNMICSDLECREVFTILNPNFAYHDYICPKCSKERPILQSLTEEYI